MFNNTKVFFKKQKANIIITLLGGLIPLFISGIFEVIKANSLSYLLDINHWKISPQTNFVFQSLFILLTLYVFIQVRRFVITDIKESKEQIKQYIKKNCGLKIYDREQTPESAFQTVQITVSQFFYAWLAVWLMWLIYYGGELFIFSLKSTWTLVDVDMLMTTYQHIFDFLNSTAMFAIYIVLTSVTANRKKRTDNDNIYLESILVWVVLFIIFMAGIIIENVDQNHLLAQIMPFYVSIISTITFVLVLGKMNSTYLKVPPFFMLVLYIYAIIQLYIPFGNKGYLEIRDFWFQSFVIFILPYITLFGKIVLMLTICWIAVQRRFLFFVIHRSTTIDRTDELLSELNKENVSF